MSNVIGIGIIGTGSIVKTYVKCIDELSETRLIGLYTKSKDRVKEAEDLFGLPIFSDLQKFLRLSEIDLICVCNESGSHGEAIKKSAEAGKHVLCEKPLEITPQKIDEVIAVCERNGAILGCALQNRCGDDYRAVEKTIHKGRLGKLLMGNAHINWYRSEEYYKNNPWRGTKKLDGGAAFINQGIHTIDLLTNLMGPVKSVFGNMKTMVHDIEGEDVGVGVLNFENGAMGTITAGTALFPGYPERLEFYGEKGSILLEGGKIVYWNVQGVPPPESTSMEGSASGAADPTNIGHINHKMVIKDMVDAMKEGRSPMVDGAEARKAVEVITSLYKSSRQQRLVYL